MGWSREEFLCFTVFDFSDLRDCPAAEELICKAPGDDAERAITTAELITKDAGRFPAEITLSRMRFRDSTCVIAVARDITVRRRAEIALRQSEDFLKNIVDNIPAMVFVKDAVELRYVAFNKAGEELLGHSRDEMIGRSDFDFFPREQASFFVQKDREVLAKGELVEIPEETVKTRHGDDRILRTKKIPLFDDKGNARYLLGISEDITERKHLEGQLLQSQKMEVIGQLAGGVAHDFNNILMVIMGYANLLKTDTDLDGRQLEKVDKIQDAADKAAHLTRSLLAFSRKQVMKVRLANLNEIVQHIQEFLVRIIGEDVQLRSLVCKEDLIVEVDRGQLEQVLINLATNARDAMPRGGILTIETAVKVVDTSPHNTIKPGRYAVISVSDNGIGMDEKTRQKIFEPFFTTKELGKGTGLGMSIVYGIVKQHKGYINIYSEPNIGTTFRIYIPSAGSASDSVEAIAGEMPPKGGTETILVAEDEADLRNLLQEILQGHGYEVIAAGDGQDAVEKFAANRDKVKLILMDMVMPRKSGKKAVELILRASPGVAVLYTSGYTMDVIQSRDLMDERTEMIMKPVQPLELLRKVREMLDR
jgi:PAS domain S-box-containing protein